MSELLCVLRVSFMTLLMVVIECVSDMRPTGCLFVYHLLAPQYVYLLWLQITSSKQILVDHKSVATVITMNHQMCTNMLDYYICFKFHGP